MKSHDKAWLAGIIDGEGYLQIVKKTNKQVRCGYTFYVVLAIAMCHKPTIDKISKMTNMPVYLQDKKDRRALWATRTSSNKAVSILREVYPFMVTKKEECDVVFEYQAKFGGQGKGRLQDTFDEKNTLYSKLRALKKVEYA